MQLNDIFFDDDNYSKYADFANQNGYFIQEIEPLNNVRRFQICAPKEKTLDELKQNKLSELTSIASKFDNQLVNNEMIINSSLGFKVNADLRSQNNIRGLISVGLEPVNFVDSENVDHSLSIEQLNTLLNECALNSQNLYLQKWAYKSQIESAQTAEELNKIVFNFEMKDFNK